jgi:lipoprotein signal peptidase
MFNCNTLLSGQLSYQTFDVLVVLLLALFVFFVFRYFLSTRLRNVGLSFVVLGGLGNVYQREFVSPGCVRDPLPFFGLFSFNAFDLVLCVGIAFLIYCLYTQHHVKDSF